MSNGKTSADFENSLEYWRDLAKMLLAEKDAQASAGDVGEDLEAQLRMKQDDWIEACREIDALKTKLEARANCGAFSEEELLAAASRNQEERGFDGRSDEAFVDGARWALSRRPATGDLLKATTTSSCTVAREQVAKVHSILELIAAPVRADGTYNRCREACELLAREALAALRPSDDDGEKESK